MVRWLVLSICLLAFYTVDAQLSPWYNVNAVNESKPGSVYKFSFIHLTDRHIGEGFGDYGTPGFLDAAQTGMLATLQRDCGGSSIG